MSVITQLKPNALSGRPYGTFRRPFFLPKQFRLTAIRIAIWMLTADRQITYVLVADHPGTFTLEV